MKDKICMRKRKKAIFQHTLEVLYLNSEIKGGTSEELHRPFIAGILAACGVYRRNAFSMTSPLSYCHELRVTVLIICEPLHRFRPQKSCIWRLWGTILEF
ncbi:hypothetical protein NPIL_397051 [Nephila pilipes]|uniref:Uncharacterized protein n=1 Tax=Nephila pilipes TaxID=299642 RepID=A0A8X6MSZ8_NEPPI|nr:hypothetical protein NPIL_397051 [Nephila pilipes]